MWSVFIVSFKGVWRDRIFQGILVVSAFFLVVPVISSLSMRQVTELSVTLSLSLISFILLLLSVFLGGTALWKDIERRYTFSVLGLPIARHHYVIGKFLAIASFVFLTVLALGLVALAVIWYSSTVYPPFRPLIWSNIILCLLFDGLKYIILLAFGVLLSTLSTSFFLPVFGSISIYLVGSASQQVFDFLKTAAGQQLPETLRFIAEGLYYLLPNFSAFDLKVYAVYSLEPSWSGLALTALYGIIYSVILITLASFLFARRELK